MALPLPEGAPARRVTTCPAGRCGRADALPPSANARASSPAGKNVDASNAASSR